MKDSRELQLGLKDSPLIVSVGVLSFAVHEFAHALCGKLLGLLSRLSGM